MRSTRRAQKASRTEPTDLDNAAGPSAAVAACGPGAAECGPGRRIGPWGTGTRLVAGLAAVVWGLAAPPDSLVFDTAPIQSRGWGALMGLVVLPAVVTGLIALRGRTASPLRLGHGAAMAVTGGVVALMLVLPVAVLTWIGSTLLVLAILGRGGCEVLAAPNLVLGRSDFLACLPFTPIDAWEVRRTSGR